MTKGTNQLTIGPLSDGLRKRQKNHTNTDTCQWHVSVMSQHRALTTYYIISTEKGSWVQYISCVQHWYQWVYCSSSSMGTDSIQGLYLQIVCSLHGVRHWYQLGITKEYTWTDCLLSSMLAGMNGFGPQCTEEESSKFSLCVLQKMRRSICKKQILSVCLWT